RPPRLAVVRLLSLSVPAASPLAPAVICTSTVTSPVSPPAALVVYSVDGFSPYSLVGSLNSLLVYSLTVPVPVAEPNAIFLSRFIWSVVPPLVRCIALCPGVTPAFRSSAASSPSSFGKNLAHPRARPRGVAHGGGRAGDQPPHVVRVVVVLQPRVNQLLEVLLLHSSHQQGSRLNQCVRLVTVRHHDRLLPGDQLQEHHAE
ncbi:Os01g0750666, partial [Oryza sativa Japonica Group]